MNVNCKVQQVTKQ